MPVHALLTIDHFKRALRDPYVRGDGRCMNAGNPVYPVRSYAERALVGFGLPREELTRLSRRTAEERGADRDPFLGPPPPSSRPSLGANTATPPPSGRDPFQRPLPPASSPAGGANTATTPRGATE